MKTRPNSIPGPPEKGDRGPRSVAEFFASLVERGLFVLEDLGAILLGALSLLTLLGLVGLTSGKLIDPWIDLLTRWMGWGAAAVPVFMAAGSAILVRRRMGFVLSRDWGVVIGVEFALLALLGLFSIVDGMSVARAETGSGGGLVGWGIATLLSNVLGPFGGTLVLMVGFLIATFFAVKDVMRPLLGRRHLLWISHRPRPTEVAPLPHQAKGEEVHEDTPATKKPARSLPWRFRKSFRLPQFSESVSKKIDMRDQRLPPLDILESKGWSRASIKEINLVAGLIEKTLHDFGLPARVVDFCTGPVVTQYAVEPGYVDHVNSDGKSRRHKVRVSQIAGLADDLALALSTPRLRIQAPVPGHNYVGIEVPNRSKSLVRLGPLLGTDAFQSVGSPLAVPLGRSVSGEPVIIDLAALPHLLIAGTTGSGKSVCITALTAGLIANNTPEDLALVLIDPKMVELVRFNGLPHLLGKVESDLDRIVGVMRWCTVEMDRRYQLLEDAGARDIDAYNRRMRRRRQAERLPRIVLMIDELSDLMMKNPEQTEKTLVRLAQMARATGIHLVVATQRPSTDIVTGLIKANFPARIAFAVASGIDSRVIIDGPGAESLMGTGDMLYLAPDAPGAIRLQGVFVADREVEGLVSYWHLAAQDADRPEAVVAPWEELIARGKDMADRDEVLEQAIELVKRTGYASASMLQRRLRVGYPRAARLMDELEELGLVGGPEKGGRTRELLSGSEPDSELEEDEQ